MGHARPQSVVGDEEHAPLGFPARDGLGNVVQEANDTQPGVSLLAHPRADSILHERSLHTPDGLQDVLERVEVVEGTLPLVSSEPELRHLAQQYLYVERVLQRLVNSVLADSTNPGFSVAAAAPPSCGWCWGCGAP